MILLYSRRAIKCFIEDLESLDVDIHKDDDILRFDGVKEIMSILNSVDLYFDKIKDSEIAPYHKSFIKRLCSTNFSSAFSLSRSRQSSVPKTRALPRVW